MAYNPFAVFRRNQKGLFAVLTVFIMIMFTLSFGGGDFFQWLPRLLGNSKAGGEPLAKIDGDNVTDAELSRIASRRNLASEFMLLSNNIAREKIDSYITQSLGTASQDARSMIGALHNIRSGGGNRIPYLLGGEQEMYMAQMMPERIPGMMQRGMETLRGIYSEIAHDAKASAEDKKLAENCILLINLDARYFERQNSGYFGHKVDSDSLQGPFEFELWRRKADKLGIRYTADDAKLIYFDEEFSKQIDAKALAEGEAAHFGNRANYSRDEVFSALADEFKVRAAQNVVIGRAGVPQTPWQLFSFYQQQCDGARYQFFCLPAENFISKVPSSPGPNEGEIRKLFDAYKNKEADPAKDNLGLREPRKLKIGWLSIKGDEPYYKKLGQDALAAVELQAKLSFIGLAPVPGPNFAPLAAPVVAAMQDPAYSGAYSAYLDNQRIKLDNAWFPSWEQFKPAEIPDAKVAQPAHLATAIAAMGGSFATHAGVASAPLLWYQRVRQDDNVARARALVSLLAPPSDAGSNRLGNFLSMWGELPKPLPLAAVRQDLVDKVKESVTHKVIEADVKAFQDETKKLAAKPDKAEVRAYIEKFVKDRGLTMGESKEFHDQYTLIQDEGLKPLADKFKRGHINYIPPSDFALEIFWKFDFQTRRETAATALYEPAYFPRGGLTFDGEPNYYSWRTADQPPESPRDFEKTRPRVIELWKRIEARKLAAAAAEAFAKDYQAKLAAEPNRKMMVVIYRVFIDQQSDYLNHLSFEERARCESFSIDNVSPVVSPPNSTSVPEMRRAAQFQLEPRRELPHPTAKMQEELLANKDKPLGTALVLGDESGDRQYVAVLESREFSHLLSEKLYDNFYAQVYKRSGDFSNAIRRLEEGDEFRAAYRNAIALLKAEFKVEGESEKLTETKKR